MKTKGSNQFALPDALGWECNDKISQLIDEWFDQVSYIFGKELEMSEIRWQVAKAQLMDDIYVLIKRYQNEAN